MKWRNLRHFQRLGRVAGMKAAFAGRPAKPALIGDDARRAVKVDSRALEAKEASFAVGMDLRALRAINAPIGPDTFRRPNHCLGRAEI